ncbi:hypothetical protein ANO11243_066780 [Dothideomycetidae sp. 11243]|nr:hypothetical protein ANO11243_066780 [fungal sp. No.11243]
MKTHEIHNRIHGYESNVLRHNITDGLWNKPAHILSVLSHEMAKPENERLHWLFWVDADTILLNPSIPIELFLPPSPELDDIHLVILNDQNKLNNGVFPIRVNQWSVDLFTAVVNFRRDRPDAALQSNDQSAMDILLQQPQFLRHTVFVRDQRWFNAWYFGSNETLREKETRPGEFIMHFAAVRRRERHMTTWLDRVERNHTDWDVKPKHTRYPAELARFWKQKHRFRSISQM